ncbi:MAG TPA: Gldg family protein [Candidatus Limnocylindrales bacterium]|nr:Gldg family protein [Candidatus Limnocylindrales bacterium]
MKKKTIETILYSAGGVAAMALILIAFNVIAGALKERVDLTKEKAFTLSQGTRAILTKLDTPVKIRFYCSQAETSPETVFLKGYAKRVEDLLAEYKQIAHGKLTIEKYDPQPDSDAEDSARLDGVEGQMLRNGEKFYLGLAASVLDEKQTVPFLDPNRERLLEYDLSRAISRVVRPEKPVVGVMSPMPIFGMPSNPMMARMGQQGQQPWIIITELKNDFEVKRIAMDVDKIDDDVKVLLVVHPRDITDKAQYAIDQFVMRGGKLIAFLDPLPMVDSREQNQMLGSIPNSGSNLEKLLKAWGLSLDTSKVVADMNYKMQLGGRGGVPQDAPAVLSVTSEGINKDDIVTGQIDNLWLPYAGAFTGTPVQGLKETVLLKSTKDSQLVDGFMANLSGENVMKEFKPSGTQYALAVRLTGKFKTAFPDGKPEEKKPDDKKETDKKDADTKEPEKKNDDSLKETKDDNTVVLVGDADMMYDRVALQPIQTLFGTAYAPANGNLSFVQNTVEQLTGDNNLIAVRSRATLNRPFTRIKAMETVANEKFQSEIKRLEDSKAEAQRKINELQQQKKDKDQRFILSPEQSAELVKLRSEEVETGKRLKQVQKDLRKEVVSLQTRLKWLNILGVPAAVTASGIFLAFVKRKKTSAK